MLGNKEKSTEKTSMNRRKNPSLPTREFNSHKAQISTRSSLCEQTLAKGGDGDRRRELRALGSCLQEGFKASGRDGEQLGTCGRRTRYRDQQDIFV